MDPPRPLVLLAKAVMAEQGTPATNEATTKWLDYMPVESILGEWLF